MKSQPCLVLLIYNFPTEIFKNFFHYWLLTFTAWKVWEFFLVHIFSYSKWIWRDTEYAGKYGPDKTLYLDTFHAVFKDIPSKVSIYFCLKFITISSLFGTTPLIIDQVGGTGCSWFGIQPLIVDLTDDTSLSGWFGDRWLIPNVVVNCIKYDLSSISNTRGSNNL